MRFLALLALTACGLSAQSIRPIPWKPSPIKGNGAVKTAASAGASVQAFFFPEDIIFPHLATGAGWETVFTLVNMSTRTVPAEILFFNQQGGELNVTIRALPSGEQAAGSAFELSLPSGGSSTFALVDTTPGQTRTGWAAVDYDTTGVRLGGFATFRQKIAGRPDFEALVPMSSYEDYIFLLPVDETQGFITALAVCNPSGTFPAVVTLEMLDTGGNTVATRTLNLAPGGHTAFPIREQFPEMAGRMGTLVVESNTDRLAGLGLRFNTAGGNSFSSVPVMNWSGLF